jgi:atypical dual specificity phosphatase
MVFLAYRAANKKEFCHVFGLLLVGLQVEHRGMTPVDAYQYVRARRPRVLLATAQWLVSYQLHCLWKLLCGYALVATFASCPPFLHSDGLQAVQEYSRRIHGVIMAQSLPIVSEPSSLIPSSTTETPSAKYIRNSNENMGGLNFADDLPVLVTNADLAGYQGIQDAGLVGNQIWHDLGVVYRVRFIATRRVVNAMSVARASAAWARFSCVWLGCQAENVVLGASMRLDQLSSSEVISHASIGLPSTCLGQMNFSGLNLPVCQSGIVNG